MPLSYFNCPDGGTSPFGECMSIGGCRMVKEGKADDRCVPLEILQEQSKSRTYSGQLSVTELGNDFLLHYLKNKFDYGVNPTMGAARLIGQGVHYILEKNPSPYARTELKVRHPLFHGTADKLGIDEYNPGYYVLMDYKIYSSYSLRELKGMERVLVESETEMYQRATWVANKTGCDHQLFDVGGGVVQCTICHGSRYPKGHPKLIPTWLEFSEKVGDTKEARQLNYYRIGLEREGYPISKMQVCAIIRDYGAMARSTFDREIYTVNIPKLDIGEEEFLNWTADQQNTMFYYLSNNIEPPMCSDESRWYGRRCKDFCEVRDICRYGGENAVITEELEKDYIVLGNMPGMMAM